MIICIQGGAEFADQCREMDEYFLSLIPDLELTIFAGASGTEYEVALTCSNAVKYFASLGRTARRITDLREAHALILPGGSPRLLLEALLPHQGFLATLPAIWGASAGAMVLATTTYLPDRGESVPGLGLITGRVQPHASREQRATSGSGIWALAEHEGIVAPLAEINGGPMFREFRVSSV